MKIILDECVPTIVKRGLPDRDIVTVQEMGWAGIKNGELLKLASGQFDVFITSDKNLRHQQNLAQFDLSIILLPSNQLPVVKVAQMVCFRNYAEAIDANPERDAKINEISLRHYGSAEARTIANNGLNDLRDVVASILIREQLLNPLPNSGMPAP